MKAWLGRQSSRPLQIDISHLLTNKNMANLSKRTFIAHSFFALLLAFLVFSQSRCKKDDVNNCPIEAVVASVVINPVAQAGSVFGQVDNFNADYYNTYLVNHGWAITDIASVTLYAVHINLDGTQGVTFADFDSAEVLIDGLSVGQISVGKAVTSISFWPDIDVKFAFADATPNRIHALTFQGVTNKAIPSLNIRIQCSVLTCTQ